MCRPYVYVNIGFLLGFVLISVVLTGRNIVDRKLSGSREALVKGYREQLLERIDRLNAFVNATDTKSGSRAGMEILAYRMYDLAIDCFLGTSTSMMCATYDIFRTAETRFVGSNHLE